MAEPAPILFSAFEPSGDNLAAKVIGELRRREPQRPIHAFGGPRMEEAGAQLIENTTDHAVMLAGAVSQAMAHRRRLARLRAWLAEHPVAALVPVDSPAANWSVCQAVRQVRSNAKIIHLVAPQLWAWAPWRIRKLRRLTDRVLCILPFEPQWFAPRGVEAVFVGHPLFDPVPTLRGIEALPADLPRQGEPKLALLPGSRAGEIRSNWATMLEVTQRLRRQHPAMEPIVAAANESIRTLIESMSPKLKRPLPIMVGRVDDVLDWCDAALVVSGTATLHVASRQKPMVALFNVNRWAWLAARWLIRTRTFTLPNLVSESMGRGRVIREFVPHFGQVEPVERAMSELLRDRAARLQQAAAFGELAGAFETPAFRSAAADQILSMIE